MNTKNKCNLNHHFSVSTVNDKQWMVLKVNLFKTLFNNKTLQNKTIFSSFCLQSLKEKSINKIEIYGTETCTAWMPKTGINRNQKNDLALLLLLFSVLLKQVNSQLPPKAKSEPGGRLALWLWGGRGRRGGQQWDSGGRWSQADSCPGLGSHFLSRVFSVRFQTQHLTHTQTTACKLIDSQVSQAGSCICVAMSIFMWSLLHPCSFHHFLNKQE